MLILSFADGLPPPLGRHRKINEWLGDSGDVIARAFFSQDGYRIDWLGLGTFTFTTTSREVRVFRANCADHDAILEVFTRNLQPIILQALGWQTLHASAVVGPAGVLAFCARKGSGKSTLAFAMQQVGWQQIADDALVLRFDRDQVIACPLPFAPRLRPASRDHFAQSRLVLQSAVEAKPRELSIVSIFLLVQDPGPALPCISQLLQARAFSALLAHAHCIDEQDSAHARRLTIDYLQLAASVPVFMLRYRPDLQQLPQLIGSVVEAAYRVNPHRTISSERQTATLRP
jgi:hypothetical protein